MRTLFVDDQPVWREAVFELLRARFGQVESIAVMNVEDALRSLQNDAPTLVFADFSTGDVCAHPGIEEIVAQAGPAPVITLDRRVIDAHIRRALAAGARGYVSKTSTRELMDAAISVVMAGGDYFPRVAPDAPESEGGPAWVSRLSPRQTEVLNLMLDGKTNREVAEALGISLPTVKLHVHAILGVAGARNRTEVVLKARRDRRG
jgi:DNA-binding NarL/FixJ family response regulator